MTLQFWPMVMQIAVGLFFLAEMGAALYLLFLTLIKHPMKRRPPKG